MTTKDKGNSNSNFVFTMGGQIKNDPTIFNVQITSPKYGTQKLWYI